MTRSAAPGAAPLDEVTALVGAALGAGEPLRVVERRPNGFSTKVASELVAFETPDGTRLPVLVKKVVDATGSRRPDPPDREARVYRALGGHPAFRAPRLLGITPGDDPHLVLEEVAGWDLRYRDLDAWEAAATQLGHVHAAWRAEAPALERLGFLERWTPARALEEAGAAMSATVSDPTAAGVLRPVVDGHAPLAAELTSLPPTLVHGDLAPKNVVVEQSGGTHRVFFVDWEWAGVGPGVLDVADLVNGLDAGATKRLVEPYARAAGASRGYDLARGLALARLQRTLFRIARSADWGIDPAERLGWARAAASLHAELTRP